MEHAVQVMQPLPVFKGKQKTVAEVVADIRSVGAAHCVFSTNYGSPYLSSPEEGLLEGMSDLLSGGLVADEIKQMVNLNPIALLH